MTNEKDLYSPVASWFKNDGYEVYPATQPKSTRNRTDIVAKWENKVTVVAMREGISLSIIERAYAWKKHAHFIYIAIPKGGNKVSKVVLSILKECKIGVLEVDLQSKGVYTTQKADFQMPVFSEGLNWSKELHPDLEKWLDSGESSRVASKSGYLSKKKSNGKNYIYLRRSYREDEQVKHEYIFSFGSMPRALEKLYLMRENPEDIPLRLTERNFDVSDVNEWILTLETQVTSTGRSFEL